MFYILLQAAHTAAPPRVSRHPAVAEWHDIADGRHVSHHVFSDPSPTKETKRNPKDAGFPAGE